MSNRCLHCGDKLPLLRKVTGGEFCCEEHRHAYAHEQSNLALSRLIDEQQSVQTGRKPRRRGIALPLPRTANGNGAHAKPVGHSGPDPAFCQWLYASNPRAQNFRSPLRSGETFLAGLHELALPVVNWRILRKRLMAGERVEWSALDRARAGAGAYAAGEGPCPFAAWDLSAAIPGHHLLPVWDDSSAEVAIAVDFEPVEFGGLVKLPTEVKMRNWAAPMRSLLPKPWAVTLGAPALPLHAEARVRQQSADVEIRSTQMAPLIRSSRLLGKAIPSPAGYHPITAEHRPWDAFQQIPKAATPSSIELAQATSFSSLAVLAARGPVALKELLEGDQLVSSNPAFPTVPGDFSGRQLQRAERVAMAIPYTNSGQRPVETQAKGIFPLPFLVPPGSPSIGQPQFRAPLQQVKQLTLAPRRGVESYQVSVPAAAAVETEIPGTNRPTAALKPVLDWLPAFGRPMAPSWEVRARRAEGTSTPAAGWTELVLTQTPALATSILSLEKPAMQAGPVKLLRLTMERVEMRNVKARPKANTDTHAPVREVIKPKTKLVPRTSSLPDAMPAIDEIPVWRQKLAPVGQVWQRLPAASKWGGLTVAALVLAVGMGTRGSYTAEATSPRRTPVASMPGESSEGGLAGLQKTIMNRAAIALTDDFRAGLADWEGQGDWARSWSYDSAGFVRTGSLALYTPSVHLTDYRLEFLGQIEQKSMSWVVRAKDLRNFYAVKITLRDEGPVPTAYLQRYAVVDGKPTEVVQKRLPMQVTQDTLYRVLMEVRQENYVLTVQGQIVDSWSEPRLKSGGVGFFSAKGELARLRWVGVWHQYDTLGRLCAFLAPYSISDRERSGGQ